MSSAVIIKTRKFKRNPLLARKQVGNSLRSRIGDITLPMSVRFRETVRSVLEDMASSIMCVVPSLASDVFLTPSA